MKPIFISLVLFLVVLSIIQVNAQTAEPTVSIVRLDPAFDKLVPKDATLEKLAGGYAWAEGPAWDKKHGYSSVLRHSQQFYF